MADGTSGEDESLKRGVPTGSARSRPDGVCTVGAGEATGAGAVTTASGGRGRGTCGGVLARRADGRGAPDWKSTVISRSGSSPADNAKCEVTLGVTPVSLRWLPIIHAVM